MQKRGVRLDDQAGTVWRAWDRGFDCGRRGVAYAANPYEWGDPARWSWDNGWQRGQQLQRWFGSPKSG